METLDKQLFILRPGSDDERAVFANMTAFAAYWMDKRPISITIEEFKLRRSDLQNRYLHGWIFRNQLERKLRDAGWMAETGKFNDDGTPERIEYTPEMIKTMFNHPFFIDRIIPPTYFMMGGKETRVDVSASTFNKAQFSKYCELIAMASAEKWGIEIEEPTGGQWKSMHDEFSGNRH